MNLIPQFKIGDCNCGCGGKDVEGRKVGKTFMCAASYQRMKAEEQVDKAKKRVAARNTGFKLRNGLAESKGTEDYFMAERQALINDLDFVVSRICRMMGSDERGLCQCYTCPTKRHFSLMQAGHYVSRKFTQTRFDLRWNLRPQCPTCNEAKHGNLEVFAQRLEEEQKGIVEWLIEMSREPYKYSRDELKTLLIDYRQKLRIIETKFKN